MLPGSSSQRIYVLPRSKIISDTNCGHEKKSGHWAITIRPPRGYRFPVQPLFGVVQCSNALQESVERSAIEDHEQALYQQSWQTVHSSLFCFENAKSGSICPTPALNGPY